MWRCFAVHWWTYLIDGIHFWSWMSGINSNALSICSVQKFLKMFKKFWMCWKILDMFKKILAMFKNFEHIFFFKFFSFLLISHHIQIFWTRQKNFEHLQNVLTQHKNFWSRSKILDRADGPGIRQILGRWWILFKEFLDICHQHLPETLWKLRIFIFQS